MDQWLGSLGKASAGYFFVPLLLSFLLAPTPITLTIMSVTLVMGHGSSEVQTHQRCFH